MDNNFEKVFVKHKVIFVAFSAHKYLAHFYALFENQAYFLNLNLKPSSDFNSTTTPTF